jgi:hypothetical protein
MGRKKCRRGEFSKRRASQIGFRPTRLIAPIARPTDGNRGAGGGASYTARDAVLSQRRCRRVLVRLPRPVVVSTYGRNVSKGRAIRAQRAPRVVAQLVWRGMPHGGKRGDSVLSRARIFPRAPAMHPSANGPLTELVKFGGCEVKISATDQEERFQGKWCHGCWDAGCSVATYALSAAALSWARATASKHCQDKHS